MYQYLISLYCQIYSLVLLYHFYSSAHQLIDPWVVSHFWLSLQVLETLLYFSPSYPVIIAIYFNPLCVTLDFYCYTFQNILSIPNAEISWWCALVEFEFIIQCPDLSMELFNWDTWGFKTGKFSCMISLYFPFFHFLNYFLLICMTGCWILWLDTFLSSPVFHFFNYNF